MEEQLKNILKKHTTFVGLNDYERSQLVEWCTDEQEFQSLKTLFQQVDVWSEQPKDESNTKLRLDQLFAIQYAGKQSASNGREIRLNKNRFSRVSTWTSISAVAAALVLTWYVYQPENKVRLAKNQESIQPKENKALKETREVSTETSPKVIPEIISQSSGIETRQQIASIEVPLSEKRERTADVETVIPAISWSENLANGSTVTLSTSNTGAMSYVWTSDDNVSEVKVMSSKMVSTEKISYRKKQADAVTSFSVKSMPEMLNVIVASY